MTTLERFFWELALALTLIPAFGFVFGIFLCVVISPNCH